MSEEEKIIIGTIGFGELRGGDIKIKVEASEEEQEKLGKRLEGFELHIPNYQRPYAWKENQVEILLNDLKDVIESGKKSYLLGSLIFHKEEKSEKEKLLNIVDGQQRLVTLALICAELEQWKKDEGETKWNRAKEEEEKLKQLFLMTQKFPHSESQKNLKNNYIYIQKWFGRNEEEIDRFKGLLSKNVIEFVCIVTPSPDDAFIFFDSANSKGKALETYDLVKAYHLSIMNQSGEKNCIELCAKNFEELCRRTKRVHKLFYELLFPVRKWIVMKSEFYVPTEITKSYKDKCYEEFCVEIPKWIKGICRGQSKNNMGILQEFEGGKDFFDYIEKYNEIISHIENLALWKKLRKIEGRGNSGNKYLRFLFEMATMIYFDKYGWRDFGKSLENIAKYIYLIRGTQKKIQRKTIPKRAIKILPLIYFSTLEAYMYRQLEHMIESDDVDKEWKCGNLDQPFGDALGSSNGVDKETFLKFFCEGEKTNG